MAASERPRILVTLIDRKLVLWRQGQDSTVGRAVQDDIPAPAVQTVGTLGDGGQHGGMAWNGLLLGGNLYGMTSVLMDSGQGGYGNRNLVEFAGLCRGVLIRGSYREIAGHSL
jgi:hypothetical protein